MRAIGISTFGSDAHLQVHEVLYSGPLSNAISSFGTSDELALAAKLSDSETERVDLVVWSNSSSTAASTLLRALRYPGLQSGLQRLRLLFVGDLRDAERIRSAVEATGATIYFRQR